MAPSEHYFSASPGGDPGFRPLAVRLAGREVAVTTANGVFSPDRIDAGTQVLLGTVPSPPPGGDLLDLGCGWGPVALSLALESPHARIWAVDVNERALDLVRRNAASLGLDNINACTPDDVPAGTRFMTIWSNPPIRVGKDALHDLLRRWLPRLSPAGEAWLVVGRNLGADPLHRWLADELGVPVVRAASAKGFRVLKIDTRPV
jgi:16S rRNA G1207 methylase RsmC